MKCREYLSLPYVVEFTHQSNYSGSDIRHVLITAKVVRGEASPGYWRKGEGVAFWEAWATEEAQGPP